LKCSDSVFWGAQAASLFFSAACRKALRNDFDDFVIATVVDVVGKLLRTTGWQPVLPRTRSAILLKFGAVSL